ncbi:unnamed protein product [Rhizoctonia solani]|uniref:Protein kinase domain-containing protein n=1 Tax=Rhizoctonia solani TaxID=456999 RepID=A0A8H3D324_9AGAM|nr:unnamed protein product [Rhizoctonia solani]
MTILTTMEGEDIHLDEVLGQGPSHPETENTIQCQRAERKRPQETRQTEQEAHKDRETWETNLVIEGDDELRRSFAQSLTSKKRSGMPAAPQTHLPGMDKFPGSSSDYKQGVIKKEIRGNLIVDLHGTPVDRPEVASLPTEPLGEKWDKPPRTEVQQPKNSDDPLFSTEKASESEREQAALARGVQKLRISVAAEAEECSSATTTCMLATIESECGETREKHEDSQGNGGHQRAKSQTTQLQCKASEHAILRVMQEKVYKARLAIKTSSPVDYPGGRTHSPSGRLSAKDLLSPLLPRACTPGSAKTPTSDHAYTPDPRSHSPLTPSQPTLRPADRPGSASLDGVSPKWFKSGSATTPNMPHVNASASLVSFTHEQEAPPASAKPSRTTTVNPDRHPRIYIIPNQSRTCAEDATMEESARWSIEATVETNLPSKSATADTSINEIIANSELEREAPESNSSGPRTEPVPISREMTASEVVSHLVSHGCQDLTDAMNHATFSEHPFSIGGFSDVYRGHLPGAAHSEVAVKALRISISSDIETPKHLKAGSISAMVSPWMGQGDLPHYLKNTPGVDRFNLCVQLCDGLSYLHEVGIVHGDLKGSNVLISDDGTPVLSDFGNSFLADSTIKFTGTSRTASLTVRWSAPELIGESDEQSKPADVYALAMTIYEVMAGTIPYHGKAERQILLILVRKWEPPERPGGIAVGHKDGDRLWDLLNLCWSFEPTMRPSAGEVATILREAFPSGFR